MTNFNDLYEEKTNDSVLSKNIDVFNYLNSYKDRLHIIKKYNLVYNEETKRFDCDNEIACEEDLVKDGKLIIPFGVINGYFDCSGIKLTSLENCPKIVVGDFDCPYNQITTLENCPKEVYGDFDCAWNQLTTLENCPKEIHGNFCCLKNKLITLKYCPEIVNGGFNCAWNQLTSLEYYPKEVYGDFICYENNIKDFSMNCKIKGDFIHD